MTSDCTRCFRVQEDWEAVFQNPQSGSSLWASRGDVHDVFDVIPTQDSSESRRFTSRAGKFSIRITDEAPNRFGTKRLALTDLTDGVESEVFIPPSWSDRYLHEQSIACIDGTSATDSTTWLVTGSEDGEAHVTPVELALLSGLPTPLLSLLGHFGDILLSRWFPSGRVVLTGSGDCQLKIFDVFNEGIRVPVLQKEETSYDNEVEEEEPEDDIDDIGESRRRATTGAASSTEHGLKATRTMMATKPLWGVPATASFIGHAGGVVGADFIDRGRNFVSCSRDGTARLWDAPTQETLGIFGQKNFERSAVDCSVVLSASGESTGAATPSFVIAYQTGEVSLFDARVGADEKEEPVMELSTSSGEESTALACDFSRSLVVVGTASGAVKLYDMRAGGTTALSQFNSDMGAIRKIRMAADSNGQPSCWAASSMGLIHRLDLHHHRVIESLSGPDLEPINDFTKTSDSIFSVSRDKSLRRYIYAS